MKQFFVSILGAGLAAAVMVSPAFAQNPAGSAAVWQPGMQFIPAVHAACDSRPFAQFAQCYFTQMERSGAPPQAVAFARWLARENKGMMGFMRDFRREGRVNIAYVVCPFRANENQVWLLVNGNPALIDVDDLQALPQKQLQHNKAYEKLAHKYPGIDLWPGDRGGTKFPLSVMSRSGRQRFVVSYYLQNVCHACARLGVARFAFNFDFNGKFLGARLVSVTPEGGRQTAEGGRQ